MALLVLVVARWPETGFTPADPESRWRESASLLRQGVVVARADRVILIVAVATLLIEGSMDAYGRLLENRLVALGMPTNPDPIVWFAAVSLVAFALGASVLRIAEARIAGAGVARRVYVLSCATGVVGLLLFANAPDTASAVAGSLLVSGIARPVTRATGAIWVNRRTPSAVRATVALASRASRERRRGRLRGRHRDAGAGGVAHRGAHRLRGHPRLRRRPRPHRG